jgi:hypothetical protein
MRIWFLHNRVAGDADGITVAAAATGTLIQGNLAVDALDDGIDIDAPGTVVRANTANDNGDLGIEAVEGVTEPAGMATRCSASTWFAASSTTLLAG